MSLQQELAANFHRWERRGRGIEVFPAPVELEPPFAPFPGHRLKSGGDTGLKPTFFSKLAGKVFSALQPPPPGAPAMPNAQDENPEPIPNWFAEKDPVVELRLRLPLGSSYPAETMAHFLTTLSLLSGPMGLEIIGTADEVSLQIVCLPDDAPVVTQQVQAHFPDARIEWLDDHLDSLWSDDDGFERQVLDFGLHGEFMRPLEAVSRIDPFASLIGGMEDLAPREVAIYQVLFTPLEKPWAENALAAVTKDSGKPFFEDGAELVKEAYSKVSRPLYGVVLRLAAKAESPRRVWDILRGVAPALRLFSREGGQSLTPLPNQGYDHDAHNEDLSERCSHRCGMILNRDELVGFAHWPSPAVKSRKLLRAVEETSRPAPQDDGNSDGLVLGMNDHAGTESVVRLSPAQRLQHVHCIGATGTGKSTMLLSMILQDLERGRGFAILDPHGDLIDRVLASVPKHRLGDVVLLDPSDEEHVTPFNVLSAHSDYEKTLLASDLVSVFRRLSTSWGDRMGIIFQNLVLAFLEHRDGGTLSDMRRFLVDADWRRRFLEGVVDPDILFYWQQTFTKLDGPKSVGPILTRLETFLTPKIIRYMVSQRDNRIDFAEIMDKSRILLVRLPQGQIGKENAYMLGSLVMVKLQQMAMGRARLPANQRTPFHCYVDECQHFVTPGMAEILSGARKYGLGLILAHQDLHQLSQSGDVAAAVMTNTGTRIVFRVSEADGRALKGDFAHYEPKDFASLGRGHAICRIERADQDFNLRVLPPDEPNERQAEERRRQAIDASRSRYTVPRSQVEAENRQRMAEEAERPRPKKAGKGEASKTAAIQPDPDVDLRASESPEPAPREASEEPVATDVPEPDKAPPALAEPPDVPARPSGMGRGGTDHQLIVARIVTEGGVLGYKTSKEAAVPGGRVDVTLESRERKIAVEVAVNSNTAHEIENLTKCLEAGFDFVVSASPLDNVIRNIERSARKAFAPEQLAKLRFFSHEEFSAWLAELAEADAQAKPPVAEQPRVIAGRRVRLQYREMSPEERRKMEAEQIEAIADLVNKNRSKSA